MLLDARPTIYLGVGACAREQHQAFFIQHPVERADTCSVWPKTRYRHWFHRSDDEFGYYNWWSCAGGRCAVCSVCGGALRKRARACKWPR